MGNPHVGCMNHKLGLVVIRMVENNNDLSNVIECMHDFMKPAKQKLKNTALLQNMTDLKPVMHNKTWWSRKYSMLKRFVQKFEMNLLLSVLKRNLIYQLTTPLDFQTK
jgi:hypothetical protein